MLLCVAVAAAATVAPTAALTHLPVPAAAARMDVYQALLTGARDEQIDRVMSHATKALAAQSCSIGRGDTTTFLIEAYAQAISGPATANFSRVLVGLDAHAHCVLDSTNQGAIVSQAKEMEFALHTLATLTEIVAGRRPGFEPGVPASAAQLTRYHAAIAATADRVIEFVHERGPFNRGACLGAGLAEAARVLPNAPNRSAWVAFSRLSWDDWRSVNDTFEDSSGYNSLWARCSWLQGAAFLQADPPDADEYTDGLGSLHALFERWAVQSIDGVGPLPAWGASTFADLSWTANFEYGASHGDRNGWFAEIATRMTSFVQQINHTRPPSAWTATPYHDYWGVDEGFAYAWEQANCSTPRTAELSGSAPAPQLHVPLPSRVLSRHNWPHGEQLFDKAVLRGGGDASNFVLLQLFDRGYHGMPDGGAVLSLASGGSQLIHGLGYTCDPADRHSRLLVRADDEAFIRPSPQVKDQHNWETPFRPGVSYRWVVSPRRYGNHMSTVFNDSQAVSIGFRIADPGDGSIPTERGFLWSLESIVGVYVNGTRTSPLPGTTAVTVAGRAGGPSNKVFWPSVMFSPPVNLSAFDVVEVTCSFNDTAALTTESEVIFDSPNGTIRTQPIIRTRSAQVSEDTGWANATTFFDGQDTLGRGVVHTRDLGLSKISSPPDDCTVACSSSSVPLLCVFDTVEFTEAGNYSAGPVWHAHGVEAPLIRAASGDVAAAALAAGFPSASAAAPTARYMLMVEALLEEGSAAAVSDLQLAPSTCWNKIPTPPPYAVNTTVVYATATGRFEAGERASFVSAFLLLPQHCTCKVAPSAASICRERAGATISQ